MFTYVVLDNLPSVPDKFKEVVTDLLAKEDLSPYRDYEKGDNIQNTAGTIVPGYQNRQLLINGKSITSTQSLRFNINEEWIKWIQDNIYADAEVTSSGIAVTHGSRYHGPHCDATRNYALIYLLDAGGDNVETVFWQEHGYPIVRPRVSAADQLFVSDYSHLTEIDRVCYPVNKWVLMNTRILHGVENIESTRIAYQVKLIKNIFFTDQFADLIL
jgi:hypothetical protein